MQYLPQIDGNQPLHAIADMALREPVFFANAEGKELVVMSAQEYQRVSTLHNTEELIAVAKALAEESERNGLTQAKLDQILAEKS